MTLVVGFLLGATAWAAAPSSLVESLETHVRDTCGAAEVDVEWVGIADAWSADPGNTFHWSGAPCGSRAALRMTVTREGQLVAQRSVRVGLAIRVSVPVAKADTAEGMRVEIATAIVPLESIRGRVLTDPPPTGWRARTDIDLGTPLTEAVAEPMPDAVAGSVVVLQARRGGLVVEAPGRLLQDAHADLTVRVVNDVTHVALEGTFLAPDRVLLP